MKLGLELALGPVLARVQAPELQEQASVQVAELARLELQVQVLAQARLELLVRAQVQLELERHLQRSCPKLQLHRHRCKVPDRSRESQ